MNSLVLFPEEIDRTGAFSIEGGRAQYIRDWHEIEVGLSIRGGVWGDKRGRVTITEVSDGGIRGFFEATEEPLPREPIVAIVAVPRPQTVKKCLALGVALGLEEVIFYRSERVVPSYLSSRSLRGDDLRLEVLKALEQACDTIPPKVSVVKRWSSLKEHLSVSLAHRTERFMADTEGFAGFLGGSYSRGGKAPGAVVAIGPETGWTDTERELFMDLGFMRMTLGARILRVDQALSVAVARLTI